MWPSLAGCLGALCLMAACHNEESSGRAYVATVNSEKIYLDEYQQRLDESLKDLDRKGLLDSQSRATRIEEEVLDAMIVEKIIDSRARELKITVTNSELERRVLEIREDYGDNFFNVLASDNIRYDDWKDDMRRDLLFRKLIAREVSANIRVSEDEAEDFYSLNIRDFRTEERVRVSQIVVRDEGVAYEIREQLEQEDDFARMAAMLSIGPEAQHGGDLGFVTRGVMPEPLDDAIFTLPEGGISPVIQSPYGYHIIKVVEVASARQKTFAQSKDQIMADIRAKKEEVAFIQWLEGLKLRAEIKKESTVLREQVKRQEIKQP